MSSCKDICKNKNTLSILAIIIPSIFIILYWAYWVTIVYFPIKGIQMSFKKKQKKKDIVSWFDEDSIVELGDIDYSREEEAVL